MESSELGARESPFHGFFEQGSVGRDMFQRSGGIRSYLTIFDVVACAKTGHAMHRMCRTYSILEMLHGRELLPGVLDSLTENISTEITQYAEAEIAHFTRAGCRRPVRIVQRGPLFYWTKLFHPDEKSHVSALIEKCLLLEPAEVPRLVSACFGPDDYDVTHVVRRIVDQNNGRFVLQAPRLGMAYEDDVPDEHPVTFDWWYTRIFGDPQYGRSKILRLRLIDPESGRESTLAFIENQAVNMPILV